MFGKLNFRLFHHYLPPLKIYLARVAINLAQRLNSGNLQLTALATWRRNLLLGSLAGFSFHAVGISDEELTEREPSFKPAAVDPFKRPEAAEGWENIYADEKIAVYRRKRSAQNVFEYRCVGSYSDISVQDFIQAQYDVEYRQKWDRNVKSLEVLAEETGSGTQMIRWETKYPYPLNPRLYIYAQRKAVDSTGKSMVVVSRALDESNYPDGSDKARNASVRVTDYSSRLLVRAHSDMNKNGLDFVLVYHDDPKAPIPKKVYEFGVNVVGPKFLTEVHNAARKLAEERENSSSSSSSTMYQEKEQVEEEQPAEEVVEGSQPAEAAAAAEGGKAEEGEAAPAKEAEKGKEAAAAEGEEEEAPAKEEEVAAPEEEETMDQLSRWREKCAREPKMEKLKAILEECNDRVRAAAGNTGESCHMEMVDYVSALDHCAIPRAFKELK